MPAAKRLCLHATDSTKANKISRNGKIFKLRYSVYASPLFLKFKNFIRKMNEKFTKLESELGTIVAML